MTMRLIPLLYLLLFFPIISLALASDADKPLDFKADHTSLNRKTSVTVFTGHVEMRQGTTRLNADKLVVYQDHAGKIDKAIATGKPAHYQTTTDNQQKPLDASGETIQYYPKQGKVIILGNNSTIKQATDQITSSHLTYDIQQQSISSQSLDTHDKSLIILQPTHLSTSETRPSKP